MAGFKKLIFIQLISWLLFTVLGGYLVALSFDSSVSDTQKKAQLTVNSYISDLTMDDLSAEKIQRTFADASIFSSFTLRDHAGKTLVSSSIIRVASASSRDG